MENSEIAKQLGSTGGKITKKKYGSDHYRKIAELSHKKRRENKKNKTA